MSIFRGIAVAAGASFLTLPCASPMTSSGVKPPLENAAIKIGADLRGRSGNSSRPSRILGELFAFEGRQGTDGWIGIGDLVNSTSAVAPSFESDLFLGAAIALSKWTSPMEREFQDIVSKNFEAYWD